MTTNTELVPCPFCGRSDTLIENWASSETEFFGFEWDRANDDTVHIVCDASHPNGPGGCGASAGYRLTVEEARTAWNAAGAYAEGMRNELAAALAEIERLKVSASQCTEHKYNLEA